MSNFNPFVLTSTGLTYLQDIVRRLYHSRDRSRRDNNETKYLNIYQILKWNIYAKSLQSTKMILRNKQCGEVSMMDTSFVWTIKFFKYRFGADLISPTISFGNSYDNKFNLTLSPDGSRRKVAGFTLLLQWLGGLCLERFSIRYKACIIDKFCAVLEMVEGEETFSPALNQAYDFRWIMHIPSDRLMAAIRDDLIVTFKMQRFPIVPGPGASIDLEQKDFSPMLDNPVYSDIKLICGDQQFSAHRCILASRSCVFKSMLKSLRLNVSGCLVIKDTTPAVFEIFLKAIYGYVDYNFEEQVDKIVALANKYQCYDIKYACEKILVKQINNKTALRILQLADECNLEPLKTQALKYIGDNNKAVLTNAEKNVDKNEWHKMIEFYNNESSRRKRFERNNSKCVQIKNWFKLFGSRVKRIFKKNNL